LTTLPRSKLSTTIAGYQTGTGPPMTLVHGVGMCADYWGNLLDELALHFALTVIDMPGHGQSEMPASASPALNQYSDAIAETIKQQSIVVGHSMGALAALDLAVRYPGLISGIAVLNGIYRREAKALNAIKQRVAKLAATTKSDSTATLERWFGKSPQGINGLAAENCRRWLKQVNPAGYADAYRTFANADAPSDDELRSVNCPALFMTGSLEPNSTPAMSTAMSELVPRSQCTIIDGARHMMSMTHGEQVCSTMIKFFTDS